MLKKIRLSEPYLNSKEINSVKSVLKTGTSSIDISSGFENEIGEISIDKINSFFKFLKKNDLFYLW